MKQYKAWLFDGDGALYVGNSRLEGVQDLLAHLAAEKIPTFMITNNSTKEIDTVRAKLENLNIHIVEENIITSAYSAVQVVLKKYPNQIESAYIVGEEGLYAACRQAGIRIANSSTDDLLEQPNVVFVGMDRTFTYQKLASAMEAISNGALYIATNPDKTFPTPQGFRPGAGAMLGAVNACVGKEPDMLIGKPQKYMYDIIFNRLGIRADEAIMVGDRFETDILGGSIAGTDTLLVKTGVAASYSPQKFQNIMQSEHKPTYIYDSMSEVYNDLC